MDKVRIRNLYEIIDIDESKLEVFIQVSKILLKLIHEPFFGKLNYYFLCRDFYLKPYRLSGYEYSNNRDFAHKINDKDTVYDG